MKKIILITALLVTGCANDGQVDIIKAQIAADAQIKVAREATEQERVKQDGKRDVAKTLLDIQNAKTVAKAVDCQGTDAGCAFVKYHAVDSLQRRDAQGVIVQQAPAPVAQPQPFTYTPPQSTLDKILMVGEKVGGFALNIASGALPYVQLFQQHNLAVKQNELAKYQAEQATILGVKQSDNATVINGQNVGGFTALGTRATNSTTYLNSFNPVNTGMKFCWGAVSGVPGSCL